MMAGELPEALAPVAEALTVMARLAGITAWSVALSAPEMDSRDQATLLVSRAAEPLASHDEIIATARRAVESTTGPGLGGAVTGPLVAWPWSSWRRAGAFVIAAPPERAASVEGIGAWLAPAIARAEAGGLLGAGDAHLAVAPSGTILAASPTAAARLGLPPAPLAGRPVGEVLAAAAPALRTDIAPLLAGEQVLTRLSVGADEVLLRAEPHPTLPPGGALVTLAPAPLRASSIRRRDRFVAAVRHEIRAPLTVLRGVLAILEEEPDMRPLDREEFIRSLRRESGRVVTFVEDILTLARLDSGRGLYRRDLVDLAAVTREVCGRLEAAVSPRGVRLETRIAGEAFGLLAEPDLVNQLVRSLIGHALKASRPGQLVEVELSRVEGDIALVVREGASAGPDDDEGSPFVTFRRSTSEGKYLPGVAIGLPLAKRIADAHGWSLRARDLPDGRAELALRAAADA